jgi:hypothetical protein
MSCNAPKSKFPVGASRLSVGAAMHLRACMRRELLSVQPTSTLGRQELRWRNASQCNAMSCEGLRRISCFASFTKLLMKSKLVVAGVQCQQSATVSSAHETSCDYVKIVRMH